MNPTYNPCSRDNAQFVEAIEWVGVPQSAVRNVPKKHNKLGT